MKKKIAILGSTGSIGRSLIKIIKNDKKNFEIILLSADKNYKEILKQAKIFKVKNLIINNKNSYDKIKKDKYSKKIKIFNNFNNLQKIFKKKIDYTMSSISGLDGLDPTIRIIKHSKKIAIANKEAIICGWNLINKELKKNKTQFIPVDSEHFSIFSLLQNKSKKEISKIYITASGGPFIDLPKNKFFKIKPKEALKHPNWKMGNKITIDSATLMNKVFEVIEAKNIFDIDYNKISILTHPKSYIHAIIEFKNGLTKIIIHEPDMRIPIFNSLYQKNTKTIKTKSINFEILNKPNLKKVDLKKFILVKLLNKLPQHTSLFETILITINDYFVHKFLNHRINFERLVRFIYKFSNSKEFQKFKKIKPKKVKDIYKLRDYVSFKLDTLGI